MEIVEKINSLLVGCILFFLTGLGGVLILPKSDSFHRHSNKILSVSSEEPVEEAKKNLWIELNANKNQIVTLIKKHNFPEQITINNKKYQFGPFADFIDKIENRNKPFVEVQDIIGIKKLTDDLFNNGVTVEQLRTGITNYRKDKLWSYWNALKTRLITLKSLQTSHGIKRMIIDGNDYFAELSSLVPSKSKTLVMMVGQLRTNLEKVFDQGITITKIDKKLKSLKIIPKDKPHTKTTITSGKKKLAIGLGVGGGVVFLTGVSGFGYWLVRRYWK